jgi:hypothetical protein
MRLPLLQLLTSSELEIQMAPEEAAAVVSPQDHPQQQQQQQQQELG